MHILPKLDRFRLPSFATSALDQALGATSSPLRAQVALGSGLASLAYLLNGFNQQSTKRHDM